MLVASQGSLLSLARWVSHDGPHCLSDLMSDGTCHIGGEGGGAGPHTPTKIFHVCAGGRGLTVGCPNGMGAI